MLRLASNNLSTNLALSAQRAIQLAMIWCLLAPLATVQAAGIQPAQIEPEVGKKYYTRYCFKEEKGKHNTTNYWRGNLVPVNSLVKLVSMGKKNLVIELEDGGKVKFINVSKYTKRRVPTIAAELLAPSAIALKELKKGVRDSIEACEMALGMTREQVIMARGYPPRHKTPSTDDNTWTYWSSKFVQRSIVFEDGLLARGRGLQ